jgi:protein-disulfide isomerase
MHASRAPTRNRRPPLSGKQPTTPTTRKERRAAERKDRFEAARDERKTRAGSGGGGSSFINTRNMTILGVAVGVLIVLVVGIGQLGNKASGKLVDPAINYPAALLDGTAIGKADAPLTMEVYGDFQCPVCARHSLDVEPSIVNSYVTNGSLRIVHHEIDLLGRGTDESKIPAIGAVCANDQGKYWSYAHWIYQNQDGENTGGFRKDRVIRIAAAAGLDEAAFSTCLDSQPPADQVASVTAKATNELAISSTPTMYLAGVQYVGLKTASDWAKLIDAALAKQNAPSAGPSASAGASAAPSASTAP